MNDDFDDAEDNKEHVRSAIDALGATLNKNGKKRKGRGRPRKYPLPFNPRNSKKNRQASAAGSGGEEEASDQEEEEDDVEDDSQSAKKRRRGSDDEEWNEAVEELTPTQRRTRKRPMLYSEESVALEDRRRQQTSGKRPRGGRRTQAYTGPTRGSYYQPTYNAPAQQPSWSQQEKERLENLKQIWKDIEYPQQAKQRFLPMLRRGVFEKALEKIMPTFDSTNPARPVRNLMVNVLSVFDKLGCSAGFLEFLNNISEVALIAVYDVCNQLFMLSANVADNVAIAQSLRFWWNTLSYKKKREWEEYARKLVSDAFHRDTTRSLDARVCYGSTEVPLGKVSSKRLKDEEEWDKLKSGPLAILEEVDMVIVCPLCEQAGEAEPCRMRSVRDIQDHFFQSHWKVHGYACHFCGMMYQTAEELKSHLDCADWVQWNTARLLSAPAAGVGLLPMTVSRMLLCCADCGWHAPLNKKEHRVKEEGTLKFLKTFFAHHNNSGLLSMVVYFPAMPTAEMTSLHFSVTPVCGGDPQAPCNHCDPPAPMRDPSEANEHYMKEHRDKVLSCETCGAHCMTDFLLRQHQMEHVHEHAYFADFLTHSARIFPPPTNMSSAPRSGWKDRAKGKAYAHGGVKGALGANTGYDLVNPMEDVSVAKVRRIMQRKREGKLACDEGFENAQVQEESEMARKVREKLRKKYGDCDGMGFDDNIWLKDEDAAKFAEWMDGWESAEGKRAGGPPKSLEVDLTPSILKLPPVEVELKFEELDMISGFMLTDNVFFCTQCNTILKGEQAKEHLLSKEDVKNECAFDDGVIEENPLLNSKMVQLYFCAISGADAAVGCPYCDASSCSITGVRAHVLAAHGVYARCTKTAGEAVTKNMALKFDIRSRLARSIDNKLGMLPSGMLAQRLPMAMEPSALSDTTWSGILHTRENTDPVVLKSLADLAESEKNGTTYQPRVVVPSMAPVMLPSRGRPPRTSTGAGPSFRPPITIQPSRQPMLSLEQSLQMRNAMQHGRSYNHQPATASPLVRQVAPHRVAPAVSMVRLGATPLYAPQQQHNMHRKLVDVAYRAGVQHMTCRVCTNADQHEAEMVKGHLMRCHMNTCGHCTMIFAFEHEARMHAKKCRVGRDKTYYFPDPRLPHVLTQCPFCTAQLPMAELHMHLLDMHIQQLEYELPSGKLNARPKLVHHGRPAGDRTQPEVERLRYKYYVPRHEVAKAGGFRQCHVCGLQLPDASKLSLHLKHHSEFMYFCWLCPRPQSAEMGSVTDIVKHIISAHLHGHKPGARGNLPCPNCKINIAARPLMHLLYECDYNFTCQLCRDLPTFESETELKEHKDKCHYDTLRRFECSDCTAYFSTTSDYMKHTCDPSNMTTTCDCQQSFKTRTLYNQHFMSMHFKGDVCRICAKKTRNGDDQRNHVYSHGKTNRPHEERHMLICAYGLQSTEQRQLLTHVSNSSFRLRSATRKIGGTQDAPVVLSDDDDDDVVEVPAGPPQAQQQQGQAAAAASEPAQPASDADVVTQVVTRLVKATVESEDKRLSVERRAREAEERMNEAPIDLADAMYDDDDVVMMDDPSPPPTERNLSARVREEANDAAGAVVVGGQNLPGYQDDDDVEAPGDGRPDKPVIREFTPTNDDDDLCVVAEVDNPGFTAAAATISNQRQKKFGCPKCSSRFITQATLSIHLNTAHQHDAGHTTIMEELGIPRKATIYICKSCCLAFPTKELKNAHGEGHGQRSYGCETCSGCAYNMDVMNAHHRRVQEGKVGYVCGHCKVEFDNDTALHEHSHVAHKVLMFYFCKVCEIGSTEMVLAYEHFMNKCPDGFATRARSRGIRAQEDAWKCIGMIPAAQLHYQPASLEKYKQFFAQGPHNFVTPSICNHRSLCVAMEKQVSCKTCYCLENMARHTAMHAAETGKEYDEKSIRPIRAPQPPLAYARAAYEQWLKSAREQRQRDDMMSRLGQGSSQMHTVRVDPSRRVTVTPGDGGRLRMQPDQGAHYSGYNPQEAQRIHNDRMLAAQMAKGGGGGSGGPRMPVLTQSVSGVGGGFQIQYNGGGVVRGPPTLGRLPHPQQHTAPYQQQYRVSPVHQQHQQYHATAPLASRPTVTPASLSTMGSLQSIAAHATRQQEAGGSGASSASSTPPPPPFNKQCTSCFKQLSSPREEFLHSHHVTDRPFVCHKCPAGMRNERDAIRHMMNHINPMDRELDMDMDCPFETCGAMQPTLLALKGHIAHHNPPLTHRISSCYLSFGSRELARAHEEAHKTSGREAGECCILCGSMDNWETEMTDTRGKGLTIKHIMKHAMKHVFYCKICMCSFQEENQMVTHYIMTHMQDEGISRSCTACDDNNMRSENDYKVHCMQKHTITELHTPKKLVVMIPETFKDYLGIGMN